MEEVKEKAEASEEDVLGAPKEKPAAVEPSENPEGAAEPIEGREKEKPVEDA